MDNETTRANLRDHIDTLIKQGDAYTLTTLLRSNDYALYYFICKALKDADTLKHIKNIMED